jgi:hypothetical protein
VDEFKVIGENAPLLSRLEIAQEQCMGSVCLADDRDEQPDSNTLPGHKYYIKSLIRV